MHEAAFHLLEEVIQNSLFPEVDLALRAGRHIDREDGERYTFVLDAQSFLESFYRRYGCELVHVSDGFFYLLPTGDQMGRRRLTVGEMLVGQTLALMYLEPTTVQAEGVVQQLAVVTRLASLVGERELTKALNPRRRKYNERVAQETVRSEISKALRGLENLGFIDLGEGEQVRLRLGLLRFSEAVRGLSDPAEALSRLIAEGKAEAEVADGEDEESEEAEV
ncbi:MAG: chromosome partition protein MukE [Phycisphaerales bacterium]|nr:chromosome partition protein MukE [Phycisphaerales bacterium]